MANHLYKNYFNEGWCYTNSVGVELLWDCFKEVYHKKIYDLFYNERSKYYLGSCSNEFLEFIAENNLIYKDLDNIVMLWKLSRE